MRTTKPRASKARERRCVKDLSSSTSSSDAFPVPVPGVGRADCVAASMPELKFMAITPGRHGPGHTGPDLP